MTKRRPRVRRMTAEEAINLCLAKIERCERRLDRQGGRLAELERRRKPIGFECVGNGLVKE